MKVPTENYTDEQLQAAFVEMRHRAVANIKVNREARGDYSSSWEQGYLDGQKWCEDEIKDIPAHTDALDVMLRERDDQWIKAFGAKDLQPKVTPDSLAKWVFRDVEQQLKGLDVMLAEAQLKEAEFWAVNHTWNDKCDYRITDLQAALESARRKAGM